MSTRHDEPAEFTGRHMLILVLSFFAVIIAVNVTMAMYARSSWTGLVVENSYVASQHFNRQAALGRAQAALGWTGRLTVENGRVRYALADASGSPVRPTGVTAIFRHPAYEAADMRLVLAWRADGSFASDTGLPDGAWIAEIEADVGRAMPYRQVERILVSNGALQ
jgi:nitrogen fixation protein FixH